jgi:hypothetical protein
MFEELSTVFISKFENHNLKIASLEMLSLTKIQSATYMYLTCNWRLILTTDVSVYLTGLSDFHCGLLRLTNLETLILTAILTNFVRS